MGKEIHWGEGRRRRDLSTAVSSMGMFLVNVYVIRVM